jgi:hypothetical protein
LQQFLYYLMFCAGGYKRGDHVALPILRELFQAGTITKATKVWAKGRDEWEPIASIPALLAHLSSETPAITAAVATTTRSRFSHALHNANGMRGPKERVLVACLFPSRARPAAPLSAAPTAPPPPPPPGRSYSKSVCVSSLSSPLAQPPPVPSPSMSTIRASLSKSVPTPAPVPESQPAQPVSNEPTEPSAPAIAPPDLPANAASSKAAQMLFLGMNPAVKRNSTQSNGSQARHLAQEIASMPAGFIHVKQLQVGDILLVQGDTAVSTAQKLSRFFGPVTANLGSSSSIHAAIVCSKNPESGQVEVAHVVNDGGVFNFLMHEPSDIYFRARIYRLQGWPDVSSSAGLQASMMVQTKKVVFNTKGSVQSVFRDLGVHTYLDGDWHRYCARSKRQLAIAAEMELAGLEEESTQSTENAFAFFCSEFVTVCYQEAIMSLMRRDRSILRILNLDPSACSPMALEGYFKSHATLWEDVGLCSFNFY